MHEDMQLSSKKPVLRAFYSRGSRLVKFPCNPHWNFWNSKKKGPIMHPGPLFTIKKFDNSEIFFAYFPILFCPNHQENLSEL